MGFDLQIEVNNTTTGIINLPYSSDYLGIGNVILPRPVTINAASPWMGKMRGTISAPDGTGINLNNFWLEGLYGTEDLISIGQSTVAYKPIFRDLVLTTCGRCFNVYGMVMGLVDNVWAVNYHTCGLDLKNIHNPDQGDNVINGGTFDSAFNPQAGILHTSSGGLVIQGTKFLEGQWSYDGNFAVDTSVLRIIGASMENMTIGAVRITVTSPGKFENVVIMGTEVESSFGVTGFKLTGINRIEIQGNPMNIPGTSNIGVNLIGCTYNPACVTGNDTNAGIPLKVA